MVTLAIAIMIKMAIVTAGSYAFSVYQDWNPKNNKEHNNKGRG